MNNCLLITLFLCLDENLSSGLFKNQITKLLITIGTDWDQDCYLTMQYVINHIFSVFKKLTHLIFFESSHRNIVALSLNYSPINFCSSTLLVLKIKTEWFDTCLYVLDGRFNQLHTLIVESRSTQPSERIANQDRFLFEEIEFDSIFRL